MDTHKYSLRREILVVLLIGALPLFLSNGFFSTKAMEEPAPLLPFIDHPASSWLKLTAYSLFILTPIVAIARSGKPLSHFGIRWTGASAIGWGVVCFILNYIAAWVVWLAYWLTGFPLGEESIRAFHYIHAESLSDALSYAPWYVAVVYAEEVFARCYLLTRIREATGSTRAAVVLSSLAYACWHPHWGMAGLVHVLVGGFLFGGFFVACGGVVAPAVAHFIFDALTLLPR